MFPHPVFQVAGHVCVECSLGFACHDVERGLSYDCAPLWIPAFAGMTGVAQEWWGGLCGDDGGDLCGNDGGEFCGNDGGEFCGNDGGQRRSGGRGLCGDGGGGLCGDGGGDLCGDGGESMIAVLVLHGNTASFPRRRESIEYDTSFVGWEKRSVPNALEASIPDVC